MEGYRMESVGALRETAEDTEEGHPLLDIEKEGEFVITAS